MRILGLLGVLVAAVGVLILVAPPLAATVLRTVGVRLDADPTRRRAAAWLLVVLGLAVAILARFVS